MHKSSRLIPCVKNEFRFHKKIWLPVANEATAQWFLRTNRKHTAEKGRAASISKPVDVVLFHLNKKGYCSIEQCQHYKGAWANRQTKIPSLGISINFKHATIDTGGSDFVDLFPGNAMRKQTRVLPFLHVRNISHICINIYIYTMQVVI